MMKQQEVFSELIVKLQAMAAPDQRAVLATLGKAERTSVRRLLKAQARAATGAPATPFVLFRLERLGYSTALQRHLRQMLTGAGRAGAALTPATQAWLTRHLSASDGAAVQEAARSLSLPDEKPVGLKLAAVSGGLRAAAGGG